jgi:ribosomal protein S18 acetylase RimI-like enzyme
MTCLFSIRVANLDDAAEIAQVHVQAWQESYKGIIEQDYLESISFKERLEQRKHILSTRSEKEKNLVACNQQGEIIGFCDMGENRHEKSSEVGQIYAIYILKQYQGKGIGYALWKHSVKHLVAHGLVPFNVLVLEHNWPARLFYEKQGGVVAYAQIVKLGCSSCKEICYSFHENVLNVL